MGATTKHGFPYPAGADPNDIPADMQALAAAVDEAIDTVVANAAARLAIAGAHLYAGLTVYQVDTKTVWRYTTAWAPIWCPVTAYVPTIKTGNVAITVGNGDLTKCWWQYLGGCVRVHIEFVLGTTTVYGTAGAWSATLPVAAHADENGSIVGRAILNNSGAAVGRDTQINGEIILSAEDGTVVSHNVPFAPGAADFYRINGIYRPA